MSTSVNLTSKSNPDLPFLTVPAQFLAVATDNLQAQALAQGTQTLTYGELLHKVLAFASVCTAAGVVNGTLVAVDATRSIETIVAILGVLFAGGVYVPLQTCDSGTADVLRQHGIHFLIADRLPEGCSTKVSLIPAVPAVTHLPPRIFDMLGLECSLEDPAYVLFTSGSTGARKGVVVPHRGILRLVNHQTFISMSSSERMLLHSPLTFDASTLELWSPLLHGGTVVLAPEGPLAIEDFRSLIPQYRITTLWLTAGLFHLIAKHAIDTFRTLQQLVVGGDVVHASLFAAVKACFPDIRLVNGYGPTENTTFTTCYVAPIGFSETKVPIGEPIHGTSIFVLDEAGQPVPDGAPGELATGGNGLALGYLNDPVLTAQRFPLGLLPSDPGERLYLTGDIVRRRADLQFDFLGRKDSEVKLAGQRVDLDSVEHAVLASGLALACTALAIDEGVDKYLVAFVVWQNAEAEDDLRVVLRTNLPSVAVPRVLYTLEAMPLTENGKVDRAELRKLFQSGDRVKESSRAVTLSVIRPEWSSLIENLWCRILHRETVTHSANFFDLGGDSLGLILMQAELQQATQFAPNLIDLFSLPTVKSIAAFISAAEGAAATKSSLEPQSAAPNNVPVLAGR